MAKESYTAKEFQEGKHKLRTNPRRSKYGAKKTTISGITFDSAKEASRYSELCIKQKAGLITAVQLQVVFDLAGVKYKADFVYYDMKQQKFVVEDVKGFKTQVYRIKKKLMLELLGIKILET